MWKLVSAGLGLVAGSLVGIALGDRWAREDFAERLSMVNEIMEEREGSAERRIAAEFLAVARMLRDDDTDRAFETLERTIERARTAITEDQGTPREGGLDSSILKAIEEYQASHPWSPPAPTAAQAEFAARFGSFAPHVQAGKVIGFRVRGVQPASVFAEIGVANGDLITHWGGQAVSLDRSPTCSRCWSPDREWT